MGDEQRLLPEDCARAYGQVRSAPRHVLGDEMFSPEHMAAAALHGWGDDAHHAPISRNPDGSIAQDGRLRLTRYEYEAALKAVGDCDERGIPRPHLPALSPYTLGYEARKAEAASASKQPQKAEAKPGKDGDK